MKKVLIIGSSNIDMTLRTLRFPERGETIFSSSFDTNLGGKGLNQAVAASITGADVTFLTALGNDNYKDYILKELKKYNLNVIPIIKRCSTGVAFINVEEETSENKIIVNSGANAHLNKKDIDKYIYLIEETDYILLQLEVNLDTIKYIIKKAKEYGKIVILNPAPYLPLDDFILKNVDYLTPNRTELNLLVRNIFQSYIDESDYLIRCGVKNVIVTLGEDGAYFVNETNDMHIKAYKTNAIDTTGAGDCFNGVFVGLLSLGYEFKEALDYASYAASISVSRPGASKSYPNFDEIKND